MRYNASVEIEVKQMLCYYTYIHDTHRGQWSLGLEKDKLIESETEEIRNVHIDPSNAALDRLKLTKMP